MNEIIKEIFMSSTCGVQNFRLPQGRNYALIEIRENKLYDQLKAALSPEHFKLFNEFVDTSVERQAIISEQYYTAGFKTGLRVAMEAFNLSDIFKH